MDNILVGIDFLNDTETIIEYAFKLAKIQKSKIWLLHIVGPDPDFVSFEAGPQSERELLAEELKEKKRELAGYAKQLKESGIDSEALLIQGATIKALLKKSEELNIDLMILGHRKRGSLFKIFFDSTAKKIMGKTDLPILIIPLRGSN